MNIQVPLLVIDRRRVSIMSTRLTFGDDRYYEFMCFDVLKVVRSPGCDHGHD